MLGAMMDRPLIISSLLEFAVTNHPQAEIVTRRVEGDIHRTNWQQIGLRSAKVANALAKLGVKPGDRIATLAWNTYRHLELYFGVSGSAAVLHTINPRLFPEQIAWIANHAEDRLLFVDLTFLPLIDAVRGQLKTLEKVVVLADKAAMPAGRDDIICYEDLIATESSTYVWPEFDERSASSLCYTSGTTGNPKGVLYSHRSTVLHAWASLHGGALNIGRDSVVLPVVPMFHVNAWGTPYAAAMVGCRLVLPGPHLDGKSLYELFENEQVTFSAGVPTVWLGLLNHLAANGLRFSSFARTVIGGSACPPAMLRTLRQDYGIDVIHAWGMTELSPLGTLSKLKAKHATWPVTERTRLLEKQGRVVCGIDMAIVDDEGRSLPWDGKAAGELVVRGHWVITQYFVGRQGAPGSPLVSVDGEGGWFPTGDVATIDADGFMQITDRSKDVIKSGGEWISSIDLENAAMAHPAVAEAGDGYALVNS